MEIHWKLLTNEPANIYQPSIITKNIILNGNAKTDGGSIIMPIDIKTDAMTISMIKNGTKIKKPISKARRSSLIINDGMAILSGVSAMEAAGFSFAKSVKSSRSFSLVFFTINSFMGSVAFSSPSSISIFSSIIGDMPFSQAFSKGGAMINIVRKRAREIITILGGVAFVAKAFLVMDKTTIIRVKDVIMTKIDGAMDNTVMSMITLNMRAVAEPVGASAIFRLNVCAAALPAKKIIAVNTNMAKNAFLIMFGGLRGSRFQKYVSRWA